MAREVENQRPEVAGLTGGRSQAMAGGVPGWMWGLVALAAVIAHGMAVRNGFVTFDDLPYIYGNPEVQKGLTPETVRWALTSVTVGNWHPVTMLSHLLDATLFGTKNAAGHHAVGVALHAVNAVLLGVMLARLTGAGLRAWAVAMLFAVHPIHVESVAWAASRKDGLSFFFMLWTVLEYARWTQEKTARRMIVVVCCYGLAVLSKPTAVTVPLLLLLLDYWPINRAGTLEGSGGGVRAYIKALPGLIKEKWLLWAAMVGACVTVYLVQKQAGAMHMAQNTGMGARLGNAVVAYVRYLGKLAWPADLAVLYPAVAAWPVMLVVASGLALTGMTAAVCWGAWRYDKRYLAVGWLWFLGVMVPMIGLVQVGMQSMADRYAYLTFPGLYVLVVWLGADVMKRVKMPARVGYAAVGVVTACLLPVTVAQVGRWANTQTLWRHTLRVTGENAHGELSLANELIRDGKAEEAAKHYREAYRIDPRYVDALSGYGSAMVVLGRLDEAQATFESAIKASDGKLTMARLNLASLLSIKGDEAGARGVYEALIRDNPEDPEPSFYLAQSYLREGRAQEGEALLNLSIERGPDYAPAYNSRGVLKAKRGDMRGAYADFAKAVACMPDFEEARMNMDQARGGW